MAKEDNNHEEKEVTVSAMVVLGRYHCCRRFGVRKTRKANIAASHVEAGGNGRHYSTNRYASPDHEANCHAEAHHNRSARDTAPRGDHRTGGRLA